MKKLTILTWIFTTCFASISLAAKPIQIDDIIPVPGDAEHALYYDIVYTAQSATSFNTFEKHKKPKNDGRIILYALLQNVIKNPQIYPRMRYTMMYLLRHVYERFNSQEVAFKALALAIKFNEERVLSEGVMADIREFVAYPEIAPYLDKVDAQIAPSLYPFLEQRIVPYYFQHTRVSVIKNAIHDKPYQYIKHIGDDTSDNNGLYVPQITLVMQSVAAGKPENQAIRGDEAHRILLGYLLHAIREEQISMADAKPMLLFYAPKLFDLLGLVDEIFQNKLNNILWNCFGTTKASELELRLDLEGPTFRVPKPNVYMQPELWASLLKHYKEKQAESLVEITWHMPYYPKGAYELVGKTNDKQVCMGVLPDGNMLTVKIPPLLARRRRCILTEWCKQRGIQFIQTGLSHFLAGDKRWQEHSAKMKQASQALQAPQVPQVPQTALFVPNSAPMSSCCSKIVTSRTGRVEKAHYLETPICLTQMVAEGRELCLQQESCQDKACTYAHPCREGSLCEMWKMSAEEAQKHLTEYCHPAGTRLPSELLKQWRASRDPRASQVVDVVAVVGMARKQQAQSQPQSIAKRQEMQPPAAAQ